MKNTTQHPLNKNELVQLITVGNAIRHKWVKTPAECFRTCLR